MVHIRGHGFHRDDTSVAQDIDVDAGRIALCYDRRPETENQRCEGGAREALMSYASWMTDEHALAEELEAAGLITTGVDGAGNETWSLTPLGTRVAT